MSDESIITADNDDPIKMTSKDNDEKKMMSCDNSDGTVCSKSKQSLLIPC